MQRENLLLHFLFHWVGKFKNHQSAKRPVLARESCFRKPVAFLQSTYSLLFLFLLRLIPLNHHLKRKY